MVDFNTTYYLSDYDANLIYLLNDNYNYVASKTISRPAYLITINSNIFIAGQTSIYKADKYLNVSQTYTSTGSTYRGIYFNCTENLIYVSDTSKTDFQVFDMNLSLAYNVSVSPYKPYSFGGYNDELYVGTINDIVVVLVNKVITRSFTGCYGSSLNYIYTNNFGLITISCEANSRFDIYYSNGTYTGKKVTTSSNSEFIGFDSKGQLVVVSHFGISIIYPNPNATTTTITTKTTTTTTTKIISKIHKNCFLIVI